MTTISEIVNYINYINELHRLIEITINISNDWDNLPELYRKVFNNDVNYFTDINSLRNLNESDIILQGFENLPPEAKKIKRHVLLFQNYLTKYYCKDFKTLSDEFHIDNALKESESNSNEKIKLPPVGWDFTDINEKQDNHSLSDDNDKKNSKNNWDYEDL